MGKRSYLSLSAEILTQYIFYASPFFNPRDVMFWLTEKFDGDVVKMLTVVTLCILNLAWVLPTIGFYFIYKARHPFFEQYKIQEWVWEKPSSPRTEKYFRLIRKTVEAFVVTQIGISAAIYYAFQAILKDTPKEELLAYLERTPQGLEEFPKIFVGIFIFETCFYWGHRFLHTRMGYQFHKDHHAYYTPISNAGNWGHPIDGILSLPFPAVFPVFFLHMHVFTLWQWTIMHIFHSQYDHSGYHFPYSPLQLVPFGTHADAHNFHHSHVMDNYGLYWRLWDYIMGTNQYWNKFSAERDRMIEEAKRGGVVEELQIKSGQVLVKTVAEERDMKSGADNLTYTSERYNFADAQKIDTTSDKNK